MNNAEIVSEKMREDFGFFKSLSHDELMGFLDFCESIQMDAGSNLWEEGDTDNYAAFILSGKLGIKKKTEFEGKYMIVGVFERGTVVGELCLLTDQSRSVTSVVLEDVDIIILTSRNFEKLLSKYPITGLKLLKHIFLLTSRRLNRSYDRMASIF